MRTAITKKSPDRAPLAERLKLALEEGIEYARGETDLVSTPVPAPDTHASRRSVRANHIRNPK